MGKNQYKMGCFNDPAWKVCGLVGGVGGLGVWLTTTTYIQLAEAGSINCNIGHCPFFD